MDSRQFSQELPPVIQLRPYQQRWIDDTARACFSVKSARIGFSYATGLKRIFKLLARENRTCTVLSASKAQSNEFVETVQKNIQLIGATAQLYDNEPFSDIDGVTSFTQSRIQFPNGSRFIALPANPRTARGYPGDAVLDEFAHHEDSYSIWAAIIRQIALGNEIDVLSTPNGEQGKYFDLAKELGLVDGVAPSPNPKRVGIWSGHFVDVYLAVAEGCPINIEEMRELIKDQDTFAQEFLCIFLKAAGAWIPIELIAQAENDGAWLDWPAGYKPIGPLFSGIDVARDRNKTVLWLDEYVGDVAWTRMVLRLHAMPFPDQHDRLKPWVEMCTRSAVDSTGMGVGIYDYLDRACPGIVMGINFAGSNDKGVKIKTAIAIQFKQRMERGLDRIPHDQEIRQAFQSIKRVPTSGGVRFEAPQIEMDSAVAGGQKKKVLGHADEFWAKGLCNLAAENAAPAAAASAEAPEGTYSSQRRGIRGNAAQGIVPDRQEIQAVMQRAQRGSIWRN